MRLVTIKMVSELLTIKTSTLYSWVHKGAIPFHKLNGLVRFDLDEIETWLRSTKQNTDVSEISRKHLAGSQIEGIIRHAIDSSKRKAYNPSNGKPGRHQVSGRRTDGTV